MASIGQLVRDVSESIRKILQEKHEADAVRLSKLRFKALLRQLEVFLSEDEDSTLTKFQMLEVELDASTTKQDISRLLQKLSEITGKQYPCLKRTAVF